MDGSLIALALPIIVYLAAGVAFAPPEIDLEVTRQTSTDRTAPGAPVEVRLSITNHGRTLRELLVEDEVPEELALESGSPRRLISLGHGKTFEFSYTVSGLRGYYQFSDLHVRAYDPAGISERSATYSCPVQLFILPNVSRLKTLAIRPRRTRVYAGNVPARTGGPGVEFFGVREYQPGDSLRWVDWKTSARHPSALFSKEFEQERVADVGIILDGRQRTNTISKGNSLFEYSASAAATLSGAFLAQGNRVSLLIYGEYIQWTLPGYGKIQREKILRALARARLGTSQVFSNLANIPTRLFPPNSQVVLISPLTGDDPASLLSLRARGYRVMLITPDPISYELSTLARTPDIDLAARMLAMERRLMLHRLQRMGIHIIEWDVTQPFEQVMNRSLRRLPVERGGGRRLP